MVDFYDCTAFDTEIKNALRTNKSQVFLPATEGETTASFIDIWNELSDRQHEALRTDRSSWTSFSAILVTVKPVALTSTA